LHSTTDYRCGTYWWWKRPFDLVVGGGLLLVLLPVLAALVLLVRLDSPGPGIYRQRRIGQMGQPFEIWKLRTMASACDQSRHEETAADWFRGRDQDGRFKTLADPRITRVGRWLRRTNLDELPQLLNVMRGEMSLVGPRPAIPYELKHYEPWYFERQIAPPGITGPWQVSRRERLSAAEMMELDLRYVREASLWLDLKILLRTGPVLVAGAVREAS
jgi:lipopolysaccharide/colanic/teichoic acid biosynthesis glycosyltransferase